MQSWKVGLAVSVLLLGSGCATNARRVNAAADAVARTEPLGVWTRPAEVGFELG